MGKIFKGKEIPDNTPSDEMIDVTGQMADAINTYTGGGYEDMNMLLRKGSIPEDYMTTGETRTAIAGLDLVFDAMPPLDNSIQVNRRVVDPEAVFGPVGDRIGRVFKDKGYVSTTWHDKKDYGAAKRKGAQKGSIKIVVPAGAKGFQPNEFGAFGDAEGEVLLPRGSRFRIISDTMGADGVRQMEMEMLND
jgi:hypothetical protein